MGNALLGGKRKTVKVMKINGEELKLKSPISAGEAAKEYPGHVILDSEAVKHYGTRAKAIEGGRELKPGRLYFLVELPSNPSVAPRRVRSGINMSAKDRLDTLMLSRRSASDLSLIKPPHPQHNQNHSGLVKVRLPKSQLHRILKETSDTSEAAKRILQHHQRNTSTASQSQLQKRVSFRPINEGEIQIAVA